MGGQRPSSACPHAAGGPRGCRAYPCRDAPTSRGDGIRLRGGGAGPGWARSGRCAGRARRALRPGPRRREGGAWRAPRPGPRRRPAGQHVARRPRHRPRHPASCTSAAVVAAVRAGGIIRFSCGPNPVTIRMRATAKVRNTQRPGRPRRRRAGDAQRRGPAAHPLHGHVRSGAGVDDVALPGPGHAAGWSSRTSTFADGNSTGQHYDGGGGGAIFDRGGQLRIVNATFSDNRCDPTGPDLGGAGVRALSQYQRPSGVRRRQPFHRRTSAPTAPR